MKRIAILIFSGFLMAGTLFAQGVPAPGAPGIAPPAITKIEGKLVLVNGMIAVQAKEKTYYVGGIQRLVGFIEGLKEGAAVKIEGYAFPVPLAPEYSHLRITKLTFNGKDYDLSQAPGRGMQGGRGQGCGGCMNGAPGTGMGGGQGRGW